MIVPTPIHQAAAWLDSESGSAGCPIARKNLRSRVAEADLSRYNAINDMSFFGANARFFTVQCIVLPIISAMRMINASACAEKEA
jgi:hypothetical protein